MTLRLLPLALALAPISVLAAQPNSSSVTTELATPPAITSANWSVFFGSASMTAGSPAPDGSAVTEYSALAAGSIIAQLTLPVTTDLRTYDSFSVWVQATATHIGDYVYLVDSQNRRRWYSLILWSVRGWQKPAFSLDTFIGQDTGFDISAVAKIRYGQAGQAVADKLRFGAPTFEHASFNHGDAASPWYVDIGTGTLSVANEGAAGTPSSLEAVVQASAQGQADIAINLIAPRITWDWSHKTYASFYFKDTETVASHYFLIYDSSLNYREWVFKNSTPGQWFRVTANLSDAGYAQSGAVDLSKIVYFEVGIFGGTANVSHTFQVDEVAAY